MTLQTILFRTLFYINLILITILAFLPDYDALPPIVSFSDLLNHTLAFTVLFLLFRSAYTQLALKYVFALLLTYALFIEVVQYFLPTRFASFSDILADSVGLGIGYLLSKVLLRITYIKNLFD